jgi:uncharacterized protein (DUF1778 family)
MPTPTRTEQVSLRVPPDTKRMLQRGASIAGQTLTDFMISTSAQRARELVEQERVITMSQEAFDAFVAALEQPARPATPLAAKIIEDYAATIREDGTFDW